MKQIYHLLLGLSCIENHTLALLQSDGFPVELLYGDSFIEMDRLWETFFVQRKDYAHFDGVDRIQDIAKRYGLLSMKLYQEAEVQFIQTIADSDHTFLILLQPEVAQRQFQVRGWHEKHYVLVIPDRKQYHVINDIPFGERTLSCEELKDYYGGEFFDCMIHRDRYDETQRKLKANQIHLSCSDVSHIQIPDDDLIAFRDMIGVYRILLRRQKAYLSHWMNTDLFDLFIRKVDSIYMRVEYMNLKKVNDGQISNELWCSTLEVDRAIRESVMER